MSFYHLPIHFTTPRVGPWTLTWWSAQFFRSHSVKICLQMRGCWFACFLSLCGWFLHLSSHYGQFSVFPLPEDVNRKWQTIHFQQLHALPRNFFIFRGFTRKDSTIGRGREEKKNHYFCHLKHTGLSPRIHLKRIHRSEFEKDDTFGTQRDEWLKRWVKCSAWFLCSLVLREIRSNSVCLLFHWAGIHSPNFLCTSQLQATESHSGNL